VRYLSTRGEAPVLDFEEVMLSGLARDGGLYVPEAWPRLPDATMETLRGRPYAEIAHAVIAPFLAGAVPAAELQRMIDEAYRGFDHAAVVPLVQLDANHWLLELFHGPTLAFKDVAMQLLVRLIDWSLARRSLRATVICATSGDTGGAAVEAFKTSTRCTLFVLHPHRRVSEVQRRQMTTAAAVNIHNIAIDGNFDDCQAIVKALFGDAAFRDRVGLSGVNSINWARVVAQVVYYVSAALSLGAPARAVSFTVPTGNFGNILAGFVARNMGVPIHRLIIATNSNDILDRALTTGRYEKSGVTPTMSPSMDIEISSNFERLLFDASGRDARLVRRLMDELKQSGSFSLPQHVLAAIARLFSSGRTDEQATLDTIRTTLAATGTLLDPHTAVAYSIARTHAESAAPMITLATAHPAKFPDVVEKACGILPGLPRRLADLFDRPEHFEILPKDPEATRKFILSRI
jgi:threonine synthase